MMSPLFQLESAYSDFRDLFVRTMSKTHAAEPEKAKLKSISEIKNLDGEFLSSAFRRDFDQML